MFLWKTYWLAVGWVQSFKTSHDFLEYYTSLARRIIENFWRTKLPFVTLSNVPRSRVRMKNAENVEGHVERNM